MMSVELPIIKNLTESLRRDTASDDISDKQISSDAVSRLPIMGNLKDMI